jgi:hypothetical protein
VKGPLALAMLAVGHMGQAPAPNPRPAPRAAESAPRLVTAEIAALAEGWIKNRR